MEIIFLVLQLLEGFVANFVDGLIFVSARVLCGSRTHIPNIFPPLVGYAQAAPFTTVC